MKDYVHRVGRTARAGKAGKSLLLLSAHEASYVETLTEQKICIKQAKYEKCLEKLRSVGKPFLRFKSFDTKKFVQSTESIAIKFRCEVPTDL